jgi:uroporphyrinogen decarboxylase
MQEMNSRERVIAAIRHEPVDRVPTDIWATGEVWTKLSAHFGQGVDILSALHIDGFANADARFVGPDQPACPPGEYGNCWGMRYRDVAYATGSYQEQVFFPLAEAKTIDDLERYRWPTTDWYDYSAMRAWAEEARKSRALMCGYMAPFYFHSQLRGLEQSMIDPHEDAEFTQHLLDRIGGFFEAHHRRMFEACAGLIDAAQVTDDFGSQTGQLISLASFRRVYRPWFKRFIDLCHEFGIKVFHHDDGAMRPFLPDLVELGIDLLNPVQWSCPGMELAALKRDFGGKICFHGGVENQRILPFGTPEEVRAEVRHCIDDLAADRTGYILAPCHNLQAVTPVANIVAMYDEAWNYGRF